MVTTIAELIKTLQIKEPKQRESEMIQLILEAIASTTDQQTMNRLMSEVMTRNANLNKQLQKQLQEIEQLSVTDHLTGLFNRRRFIELLRREIDRKLRYNHTFSVIMFDIDKFKSINDIYGHAIGDRVLRTISDRVIHRLRHSDVLARWGGEEFMVLLTETGRDKASSIAEELRLLIASTNFSPVPQVTSSFGVVTSSPEDRSTTDQLTQFVDLALYRAKETGRCKVVHYEDMILHKN